MSRHRGRVAALALFALSAAACSDHTAVRSPTAAERALIVATVRDTWAYESTPLPAGHRLRLERPRLKPQVVRIRVSGREPRFATALVELRDRRGAARRDTRAVLLLRRNSGQDRGQWGFAVAGPALSFPGSCSHATPLPVRDLMCPSPWSVLGARRPQLRPQVQLVQRIVSPDLHAVDWRHVALPGGVCGSSRPIRPRFGLGSQGETFIHGDVDLLWWNPVWVYSWGTPTFGDLDGDGQDEAGLGVVCANGGGTAGGQLGFADVVFKAVGRSLRVVGIVTPRQPLSGAGVHVPLVAPASIRRGRVIAPESWYGPYDGSCCGSGRARTTWKLDRGTLRPTRTEILQRPWMSPLTVAQVLVEPGSHELGVDGPARIPISPQLRIAVAVGTFGHARGDLPVTLRIRQRSGEIVRMRQLARVTGSDPSPNLLFDHLGRLRPGEATVTLAVHAPGTQPLTYRVVFMRR